MAPAKITRAVVKQTTTLLPLARKGITRRAQNIQDQNANFTTTWGKRKADHSPVKTDKIKRSALGNLTNNVNTLHFDDDAQKKHSKEKIAVAKNLALPPCNTKVTTRANARNSISRALEERNTLAVATQATNFKKKETEIAKLPTRRISNEFNKTEDSLYMSALEDISTSESVRYSGNFEAKRRSNLNERLKHNNEQLPVGMIQENSENRILTPSPLKNSPAQTPDNVVDFDKANWNDPFQVSHYAMDIFNYLKSREAEFQIDDYMEKQIYLSKWMRSLLVDWMVEVQETFELNHETLYLAVKLVDIFLCKVVVHKDKLQLLGAAALFIACKFDERTPPLIEDFLYICDGAYSHDELIQMEMTTLKTIGYDLGIPLSYRFLRRYARCAKVPMPTLTLARYILEFSLMDYAVISFSDSQLASAALFIALRMQGDVNPWSKSLQYYTGYNLGDFADIVSVLNIGLHRKPKGTIKTIRSKYSHKIFHEVAKVPVMNTEKLFKNTEINMVQATSSIST